MHLDPEFSQTAWVSLNYNIVAHSAPSAYDALLISLFQFNFADPSVLDSVISSGKLFLIS